MKSEGKIDEYLTEEHDCEMRIKEIYEFLWMAAMGEKEKLRMYFLENLQKNTQLAKENKIRFGENYRPLLETL